MNWAVFTRIPKVLLALSVSVWMAGGCLFGCSNMHAMAAEVAQPESIAVSGDSCHSARHDCCTKPNSQKRNATRPAPMTSNSSTLTGLPRELSECPLVMNSRAVKTSGGVSDPGRVAVAILPAPAEHSERTEVTVASSYLPNRGPTHLRNCVFLI